MRPSINVITLGVGDLQRSLVFYRDGLGLPTEGVIGTQFEHGAVVFFRLNGGLVLALFPLASLEQDARVSLAPRSAFSIGHNVRSRQEVDEVMREAQRAGARITDAARERVWGGYSGYFQDLDQHLWEVVWNPQWTFED